MGINTYPEMNERLVELLRISDEPDKLYAAQRIEELETERKKLLVLMSDVLTDIEFYAPHAETRDKLEQALDEALTGVSKQEWDAWREKSNG